MRVGAILGLPGVAVGCGMAVGIVSVVGAAVGRATGTRSQSSVALRCETLRSRRAFAAAMFRVANVSCTSVVARASSSLNSVAFLRNEAFRAEGSTTTEVAARVDAPNASRTSTYNARGSPAGSSVLNEGDEAAFVSGTEAW